jgi:2-oxoglutarate dehydrogenase E2 component (dihydrolipoamide succinyltransferase)
MKIDIKMPKLGESLTEGTVLKWLKQEGDAVKKDETLLEVSTDKVDSEIPSPTDGVLTEIVAKEQETVPVDAVLGRMDSGAEKDKTSTAETGESTREKSTGKSENNKTKSQKSSSKQIIIEVVMPKMGESLTEGIILKWWKKPGETIKKDETLLEISTDKVDSEIPSPDDGVVKELLFQENETIEVGKVIARLAGESGESTKKSAEEAEVKPEELAVQKSTLMSTVKSAPEAKVSARDTKIDDLSGRFLSPLVRTIAKKEGVSPKELERIAGSGKGNRVTKNDIFSYLKDRGTTQPIAQAPEYSDERINIFPMDNVRKKIANHMRRSLDTSAHVYSISECDMTRLMNLMYARREEFQKNEGFKLTVTPLILQAVVKSLQDFPRVNASLDGDNIVEKKNINIGIAVAAPRGLIVPVIKNAEEKSFTGLARTVNDLANKARTNQLNYQDIEGSTFSVTNYGIFGNIIGLPIINQPNVAILGIGAIKKRPIVIEAESGDMIGIRSMAYISMSYDHRLVDGELGGRFMQRLVEYLEEISEDLF